jgi:mono/diheme cytochrome c family protein
MARRIVISILTLLAASCVPAAPGWIETAETTRAVSAEPERRGLEFARARCSGCHAIRAGSSHNQDAPPFAAIVNTPGLSADTLKPWLLNSHNYPEAMNFSMDPREADHLVAYMLTLKDPAYRPMQ